MNKDRVEENMVKRIITRVLYRYAIIVGSMRDREK
jgi:hypothetical protein